MGIITWIIFGLLAGIVAKWIMPGRDPGGFVITIAIGIVGALIGGFVGGLFGFAGVTGFNLGSFVTAVLGALLLLFLYRRMKA
jgi:uncharacterized membrane protein YeaQ/YmgE (transglycosylase-associated protein family)